MKCRRPKFSIRTLIIVMSMISLVLSIGTCRYRGRLVANAVLARDDVFVLDQYSCALLPEALSNVIETEHRIGEWLAAATSSQEINGVFAVGAHFRDTQLRALRNAGKIYTLVLVRAGVDDLSLIASINVSHTVGLVDIPISCEELTAIVEGTSIRELIVSDVGQNRSVVQKLRGINKSCRIRLLNKDETADEVKFWTAIMPNIPDGR